MEITMNKRNGVIKVSLKEAIRMVKVILNYSGKAEEDIKRLVIRNDKEKWIVSIKF